MIIDDIKSAHVIVPNSEFVLSDGILLLRDALESDLPFVMIGLPAPDTSLLVAADGSALMLEELHPSDEFDDFILSDKDILSTISAQGMAFDACAALHLIGKSEMLLGVPYASKFKLLGLSSGARKHMGFDRDVSLADITTALKARGFDATSLNAAIKDFSDGFDEPLFCPEDFEGWSKDDAAALAEITVDCLVLLPDAIDGDVQFMSSNSDYDEILMIDGEERYDIEEKIMPIISRLFDFKKSFVGRAWEYNDGVRNRESGYCDGGACIFTVDVAPVSQHERLVAMRRLTKRLQDKSIPDTDITALLTDLN
jgi:hypothetical protein